MSLVFDWNQWAPYLEPKIKDIIESVEANTVDMLTSSPKVNFIRLGRTPPLVTLTKISTLTKDQTEEKSSETKKDPGFAK